MVSGPEIGKGESRRRLRGLHLNRMRSLPIIWGLSSKRVVMSVFLMALGIRCLLLVHVVQDQSAVLQPDSRMYE